LIGKIVFSVAHYLSVSYTITKLIEFVLLTFLYFILIKTSVELPLLLGGKWTNFGYGWYRVHQQIWTLLVETI